MPTLGDLLHNINSFFTLQRTVKAASRRPNGNPVTMDYPPGGQYADWHKWDDARRANLLLATSWTYAGINKIAMAALPAELKIKRMQGEKKEDILNHPVELLIKNPNPDMSRELLYLDTFYSIYLHAAYWFLYPDTHGDLAEIWPMPFDRVRPIPDDSRNPDRLFKGFVYTFQRGDEMILLPDNVVYLRFPNPLDHYSTLPPARALARPAVLDNAQSQWNTKTFDQNSGLPAAIVSADKDLGPDQFEQLKRDLREQVGKRMVVRGGSLSVDFLQMTNEEMQFLESREFNKAEIYEVLGIPLNLADKEAWRWFINNTVYPVLLMLAGQVTTQLVRPYFGNDIVAEFDDIRPQDKSMGVQESVQYAPFRSFNEERATRGEPALKPVIIPDYVDTPFVGFSLYDDVPSKLVDQLLPLILKGKPEPVPAQLEGFQGIPSMPDSAGATHQQQQEEAEANPDLAEVEQETEIDQSQMATKAIALEKWERLALNRQSRHQALGYVNLDQSINELDSYKIAAALGHCHNTASIKAVFNHVDDYLKAEIASRGDEVSPAQLELEAEFIPAIQEWLQKQSRRIAASASSDGNPPDSDFWTAEKTALIAFLTSFVSGWVEVGVGEVAVRLGEVGLGLDATVNARAAEWAGKYALEMARELTETTRELAKAKIKQWLQSGKPLGVLEESLGQVISPMWRASLIAQTEVTNALRMAAVEAAAEIPVIKGYIWLTAMDERVCPICRVLNETKCTIGGMFPGGYSPNRGAHPRCRCGVSYWI